MLTAWLSVPVWEALLRLGDVVQPTLPQWLVETGGWAVAGLLHAATAPRDWRGSAAWPAAAWLLLAGVQGWDLASRSWVLLPVLAAAYGAVRALHEPLWRRVPALVLTGAAALVVRWSAVGPPDPQDLLASVVTPRPADAPGGPPLVVVTVDTLRADAATRMRSFDYLARRGSVFPRAMAASSWTVPSLATLWTGEPTAVHGAGRSESGRFTGIRHGVATLAEELGARGYRTAAIVTNPFVARPGTGFRRGFETWKFVDGTTSHPLALAGWPPRGRGRGDAKDVVDAALHWLDHGPRRSFLLWVHLFEPHMPYAHAANPGRYTPKLVRDYRSGSRWYVSPHAIRKAYDREVAHADRHVLRLLRELAARGHFREGAVVLTSDHGEEFLEHGGLEHGHSHHGEVIDVPLALAAPGTARGERAGLASLQDVAPTLRAVAGLPPRGRDLRQAIAADRVATAEGNLYFGPARSLRTGSRRVIERRRSDAVIYDLKTDPHEKRPREPTPERFRELRRHWATAAADEDAPPGFEVDDAGLRALGYVQ